MVSFSVFAVSKSKCEGVCERKILTLMALFVWTVLSLCLPAWSGEYTHIITDVISDYYFILIVNCFETQLTYISLLFSASQICRCVTFPFFISYSSEYLKVSDLKTRLNVHIQNRNVIIGICQVPISCYWNVFPVGMNLLSVIQQHLKQH